MKKIILCGILSCVMALSATSSATANMTEGPMLTPSAVELRTAMRKLWEEHITYTRNYIVSDLANLGDKAKIAERLLRNQADIGDALKPIYGDEASNKLTALLKEHIVIATKVVEAAKKNQSKALIKANDDWKSNGNEIAAFLSGANPNWEKNNMQEFLSKHLELTTDEVTSRLKKNWAKDIVAYDEGHEHMLMFADELTRGIVKQFPDKFAK